MTSNYDPALARNLLRFENKKKSADTRRFLLVPFHELLLGTTSLYLVKGLIPRIGIVVVWGPPKCGKSFWIFDLAMHVALGREKYRGRRVISGPVVYCAFEGANGFNARAAAFRKRHNIASDLKVPFLLMPMRMDLIKDHAELIASINDQCESPMLSGGPTLVVLDTLNRSLRGSESSDEDMTAYLNAADAIREAFNCVVAIVHHCGVDSTRPRGHTSLTGTVDAQLAVKRDAADNVLVTVEHMKDGPEGDVIASRLEKEEVGTDEDGDPITSCVIMPVEISETRTAEGPRLTKNQQTMFSILHDAGCLTKEQWNERARDAGLGTSRKADLHDLRTALLHKQLVYETTSGFRVKQP
jgi:AAA domain